MLKNKGGRRLVFTTQGATQDTVGLGEGETTGAIVRDENKYCYAVAADLKAVCTKD